MMVGRPGRLTCSAGILPILASWSAIAWYMQCPSGLIYAVSDPQSQGRHSIPL